MSEQVLSFGRVFAIQFRLALGQGWRGRAIGFGLVLVQLVAIVVFGAVLGLSINSDGVSIAQVVDFAESFNVPLTRVTAALLVALGTLLVVAWFGPFKLWEGEPPSKREYHWSMPVAKHRHDLARVAAGVVLLMGWALVLYGSVVILALFGGQLAGFAGVGPRVWLCLFLGPIVWYLVTSFFTVHKEHPSGWLWSIIGATAAVTTFSALLPLGPVVEALEFVLFGRWGIVQAVGGPVAASVLELDEAVAKTWPLSWALWAAVLAAAVVWAARDRRRIP